jgi:hypothetical protein
VVRVRLKTDIDIEMIIMDQDTTIKIDGGKYNECFELYKTDSRYYEER